MSPLVRATAAAAGAILATGLTVSTASAARDTTRPTAPPRVSAAPYQCLSVVVSAFRSTDDVTPQSQLRYEAFADGVFIGNLVDAGHPAGAFGFLHLLHGGQSTVTARAVDAAGNRSAMSPGVRVTAFFTPGCAPGRLP